MRLFNTPNSQYDIIIDYDILALGFVLDHAYNVVMWDGLSILMKGTTSTSNIVTPNFTCLHSALVVYAASTTPILKAKYKHSLSEDVVYT